MRLEKRWAICLRKPAKFVADFKHRLWLVELYDRDDGFYGGPTCNARLYRSERDARQVAVAIALQMVITGDVEVVEVSGQLVRDGFLE